MQDTQPGVIVTERAQAPSQIVIRSAVPVFIGYTERHAPYALHAVRDFAEFEAAFGGPPVAPADDRSCILYYAVKHYFDTGGRGGYAISLGSYEAAYRGIPAILEDLWDPRLSAAIDAEPEITLAMFPDMILLPDTDPAPWVQAWAGLLNLCHRRKSLFALLETPDDPDCSLRCVENVYGTSGQWGAAYWPRLVVEEVVDGRNIVVPPSTAMAASIEAIDADTGVWTAPANQPLARVIRPSHSHLLVNKGLTRNGASFNLIRSFPGRGTRAWGCRTLSPVPDSPQGYVQVRRLLSYAEANLSRVARMFVFEANNEITWIKVKGQMSAWLERLWQQGGLRGDDEREAFGVALGLDETMSREDVRAGRMIVRVRLSPLYPAEFIELTLEFDMLGGRPVEAFTD